MIIFFILHTPSHYYKKLRIVKSTLIINELIFYRFIINSEITNFEE